ncbi:MAG: SH3 domain-containing protein [Myxococcota bacterium]
MLVLSLMALVASDVSYSYSGPQQRKDAPLDAFHIVQWPKGHTLYTASPDINLRTEANTSSEVVEKLPMGVAVRVLAEPSLKALAGGRADYWYRVKSGQKTGYLHGSTLTPFAYRWSRRSQNTVATVAWGPNYKIIVRVLGASGAEDSALQTTRLDPGGQAYACCGGYIESEWISQATAGAPLLKVHSTVEACADHVTYYLDFDAKNPRVVLTTSGLIDPPTYARASTEFRSAPRQAEVKSVSYYLGDNDKELCKSETTVAHRWDGSRYVPGAEKTRELTPCPEGY